MSFSGLLSAGAEMESEGEGPGTGENCVEPSNASPGDGAFLSVSSRESLKGWEPGKGERVCIQKCFSWRFGGSAEGDIDHRGAVPTDIAGP